MTFRRKRKTNMLATLRAKNSLRAFHRPTTEAEVTQQCNPMPNFKGVALFPKSGRK